MNMNLLPKEINELYFFSHPSQISTADALLHFCCLQNAGHTQKVVTILSEPFHTTFGSRMLEELIEPLSAVRNREAVLGPLVIDDGYSLRRLKYGVALYIKDVSMQDHE